MNKYEEEYHQMKTGGMNTFQKIEYWKKIRSDLGKPNEDVNREIRFLEEVLHTVDDRLTENL